MGTIDKEKKEKIMKIIWTKERSILFSKFLQDAPLNYQVYIDNLLRSAKAWNCTDVLTHPRNLSLN